MFGYRGRSLPKAGHLLVVSGGTAHGIGLESPTGESTLRARAATLARGGLDAAGFVRSPFTVDGKQRLFAEPPHMQASCCSCRPGRRGCPRSATRSGYGCATPRPRSTASSSPDPVSDDRRPTLTPWRRTSGRLRFRPTDEQHRVTTLELFFDLVFVFAFTQVTALMADGPDSDRGAARTGAAGAALVGLVLLRLARQPGPRRRGRRPGDPHRGDGRDVRGGAGDPRVLRRPGRRAVRAVRAGRLLRGGPGGAPGLLLHRGRRRRRRCGVSS